MKYFREAILTKKIGGEKWIAIIKSNIQKDKKKKSNYRRNRKASMSMKAFPDAQKTASC